MSREEIRFIATYVFHGSTRAGYWLLDGRQLSDKEFDETFPKETVSLESNENPDKRMAWASNRKSY